MKTIAYPLAAIGLFLSLSAAAQTTTDDKTMGLAERRIVKSFQDGEFQELTKEANEAAGKTLKYEVNWEQLAEEESSHLYADSWPQIYFEPLIQALKDITADDMGKEAIKEGLETVVIRNQEGCYSPDCWANFTNKTLTLDHKLANVSEVDARAKELQATLENGL